MTTFTGPVHILASADSTRPDFTTPAFSRGTISLVSAGGTGGAVFAAASNPIIFTSASAGENTVRFRGLVKMIVDGTVVCVPFFYSTT